MSDALHHRGPDDGGVFADEAAGIMLAHRRLSIIDVSQAGHQPMRSANGCLVIAFNGEVYNHAELRDDLVKQGWTQTWRGHSDTETLLAAFSLWGVEATLKRATGMFALALWDRERRELWLARDRFGEKPLYYGWVGDSLLVGSELKALRAYPDWQPELDRDAFASYVRVGYVPVPRTIYSGIFKLPPGCMLRLTRDAAVGELPTPKPYWQTTHIAATGLETLVNDDASALNTLESLLKQSIRRQMVADVPLGAFLSGGIDSSTVVALMQAESSRPVRTFSIGFEEAEYNEATYAKAVAEHLGTAHTEYVVSAREALDVVPHLPELYDEPFADSSQIPTYLVAGVARRQVTVSLSGDGGDELFGGYNRYKWGQRLARSFRVCPPLLRSAVGGLATSVSPTAWDQGYAVIRALKPARLRLKAVGDKVHKLAGVLSARDGAELYRRLVSLVQHPERFVVAGEEHPLWRDQCMAGVAMHDLPSRMMLLDQLGYLPDDILVKVDRAAMGVSLETRVPFLDAALVEFAWRLPLSMKIRGGQGKWLLRQLLYKYVPPDLVERPKMGFGIPLDAWLRGALRDWAEHLLDTRRLKDEGLFQPEPVQRLWREHLSGRRNWQHQLWVILMFQAWKERWL